MLSEESEAAPGPMLGRPRSEWLYTLGRTSVRSLTLSFKVKISCWLNVNRWTNPGPASRAASLWVPWGGNCFSPAHEAVCWDRSSKLKPCGNDIVRSLRWLSLPLSLKLPWCLPSAGQWIEYLDSTSNISHWQANSCEYLVPHFMHQNSFILNPTSSVYLKMYSCWKVRGGDPNIFGFG